MDTIEHRPVGADDTFDFVEGVDDGGVIPSAEDLSDFGERKIGQLPTEIHTHLATHHQRLAPAWSLYLCDCESIGISRSSNDVEGLERGAVLFSMDLSEDLFGHGEIDLPMSEGGERSHSGESPLELSDVVGHGVGDVLENFGWHPLGRKLGAPLQNGKTRLQQRGLNVGHQAPLEARPQAILNREIAGVAVGGNHQLLAKLMKGVERMKELFEDLLLALEKLNVV